MALLKASKVAETLVRLVVLSSSESASTPAGLEVLLKTSKGRGGSGALSGLGSSHSTGRPGALVVWLKP